MTDARELIAALYVEQSGVYSTMGDIECWDKTRDARTYDGPHKVIAHPPCARWSVLAPLVESLGHGKVGDDDGCFAAALAAVRKWGGVLEHPRMTSAWATFGLTRPVRGRWTPAAGGWVTEVSQAAYGHRAQKLTWLYLVGAPGRLVWTVPRAMAKVSDAGKGGRTGERMSPKERRATPAPFARMLVSLVRGELEPSGYQAPLFTAKCTSG